ncbi:uncharacterized protein EI97DRAFT_191407 [Westerdykella ornata]|uniref:Uncharacterized protein n=1 Tax=Westerdykella ornata TaxID=318751 RepID=A0A6A6J989_WESOR|nr:uncharacterized protein EI97DRAFT_191407 [Westerdykella ornata]KAF2272962.1 hypothetical protein EI97DRAFT_191407 [Westerdykella ornata]
MSNPCREWHRVFRRAPKPASRLVSCAFFFDDEYRYLFLFSLLGLGLLGISDGGLGGMGGAGMGDVVV